MTIEGNYTITIAKLTDWLKTVKKLKPIAACTHDFSRLLSTLQVIIRNSDWFIALFTSVVIGRSDCFGICSSIVV